MGKQILKSMLVHLPSSPSLTYLWNLGSFIGLGLVTQIISGLLLLLNYNTLEGYDSVMFISLEVSWGWLMKIIHANNASVIFILLYLHLYKNISVFGYRNSGTWNSGIFMMLLIMGAAFSGYVLVSSQMSFWAAMVITSLLSVVPINGDKLLYMVWGGYSITWVTYQTLLVVHFILPFVVMLVMFFHLNMLHLSGSTNPFLSHMGLKKVTFYPYYWAKDMMNVMVYLFFFLSVSLYPYTLGEVELYEEANSMNSPLHIVPEWYFCSYYAILRSVPNKSFGVILMLLSIIVYFMYPLSISYITPCKGLGVVTWFEFALAQIWLTHLGGADIAQPYVLSAQLSVVLYFVLHLITLGINMASSYYFE